MKVVYFVQRHVNRLKKTYVYEKWRNDTNRLYAQMSSGNKGGK